MPITSEIVLKSKRKLKKVLADKEVYDVLLFGSAIKGKAQPRDIDVCLITHKKIEAEVKNLSGVHISIMKPEEFFTEQSSLANTLLREGYSLKKGMFLAEELRFKNKVLFTYRLNNKKNNEKVKIVTILRGKGSNNGLVQDQGGEWIAQQVFQMPIDTEQLIDQFLRHNKINYTKNYVLIH